jgi:hypothetical protein
MARRPEMYSQQSLSDVETKARGKLTKPDVRIAEHVRLPHLHRANGPVMAWPPHRPNPLIGMIMPDTFDIREAAAGVYIEERHRHMLEDNRRQIAEAKKRQREREKREAAEIEAAKEADRKEYAARGWPARG